jgi:hypothetical protein
VSDSNHVEALGAMYQGEKTDSIGIFNVSMLLMAIAVGYIGTSLTLSGDFGEGVPWSMVLLLPFPLWLIAAYHALVALSGMTHGISLGILEEALYRQTGLPTRRRDGQRDNDLQHYVGSQMSNRIMDINQAKLLHKLTSGFVYGGFYLAIIGYTAYIVFDSWRHLPLWQRIVAIAGYTALVSLVGATWKLGFKLIGEGSKVVSAWREGFQEPFRGNADHAAEPDSKGIASTPAIEPST